MADKLIGFRLERFKLERHLGRGTFGEVYLAHDGATGRRVSLKLLAPAEPAESQEGFRRELEVLRRMNHPLVPPVIDTGEVGGRPFVALGYVEGTTLRELLDGGKMEGVRVAGLGADLASILVYVHQQGLVHGDLKPENVVVDVEGRAHLIDFGLARGPGLPPLPPGAGTPRYLAPEQLLGREPDLAADLYQLGLLLYECAAGRPAYAGHKSGEERLEARRQPPPRVPGLEPGAMELLLDMLRFEAEARPHHALEVAGRLNGLRAARLSRPIELPVATAGSPHPAGTEADPTEVAPPVTPSGALQSGTLPPLPGRGLAGLWILGILAGLAYERSMEAQWPHLPSLLVALLVLLSAAREMAGGRIPVARIAVFAWGAIWARLILLVGIAIARHGGDVLNLILRAIPVTGLAVMLGIPLVVLGVQHLTPEQLAGFFERELGPPALAEVAAPGTGHAMQGEWVPARYVAGLALCVASLVASGLELGLLLAIAAASLAVVIGRGSALVEAREQEEARLLVEILDSSPEKLRCQSGMALLTAALAGAQRRREWEPPALARGRGPLVGKAVKEHAAQVDDAAPCFTAGRMSLLAAGGQVHLFCERHDLCPSPLQKPVDRTATTRLDAASSASDQTVVKPGD